MGSAISSGRLFDRRDEAHAFRGVGYYLNTVVKCKDEKDNDCTVDVDEVSSRKVNARIVLALESAIEDMIEEATQGFRHQALKTGVQRRTSAVATSTSPASPHARTPNDRHSIPSRSGTAAVITPERLSFGGDRSTVVSVKTLSFDRNGSPARLRRLLVEDALQLRGGDEVTFVMKASAIGPRFLSKIGLDEPSIADEIGFFRGCHKYIQMLCVVKCNPKVARYCQDSGERDRNELIDFISKGEGLTLQPCLHSIAGDSIGIPFQVKFGEMIVLPDADCAKYELWDRDVKYRDYSNLFGYRVKPGHIISSGADTHERIQIRSFADAAKMYPIVTQMRKELDGDPMATMEVALSALDKVRDVHRIQSERKTQSESNKKKAKKRNVDRLREELASTAPDWAKKRDTAIVDKISLYYEDPYNRKDWVLLDAQDDIQSFQKELPQLWKASSVIASDWTLVDADRKEKKDSHRLLWCISTLRLRNPQLLVHYATVLRLGLMAIGKGKGILYKLTMGLIASDTTVRDFMRANFEKFHQLQKDGLRAYEGPERLVFDNFQMVRAMRWMAGGISSNVVHATISAMMRQRLPLWKPGDTLSYGEHRFKIISADPVGGIDGDHYEVSYQVKSLSKCTVPLGRGDSDGIPLDEGEECTITFPTRGWEVAEAAGLEPHPPLVYHCDQIVPKMRGMTKSPDDHYADAKSAHQLEYLATIADSKYLLLGHRQSKQVPPGVSALISLWNNTSSEAITALARQKRKEDVLAYNPHADKISSIVYLPLSHHNETVKGGLRSYLVERALEMGCVVRDGSGRLQVTSRGELSKIFITGDEKTVSGMRKYERDLRENAELGGNPDDVAMHEFFKRVVVVHDDLHLSFHIADAIMKEWFECLVLPIRGALGMKRITIDPIKSGIPEAKDILNIINRMLKLHFLLQFLKSREGEETVVEVTSSEGENESTSKAEHVFRVATNFQAHLNKMCEFKEDDVVKYAALFVKACDLLFLQISSTKCADAVTLYQIFIEAMPLFQRTGKRNYVGLGFSWMDAAAKMSPADLLQEFINHTAKMNEGKNNIEIGDVAEKGNGFLKRMDHLPIDQDALTTTSFFMDLANAVADPTRTLLGNKKDTRRSKGKDRYPYEVAVFNILESANVVRNLGRKGGEFINIAPHAAGHKIQTQRAGAEDCDDDTSESESESDDSISGGDESNNSQLLLSMPDHDANEIWNSNCSNLDPLYRNKIESRGRQYEGEVGKYLSKPREAIPVSEDYQQFLRNVGADRGSSNDGSDAACSSGDSSYSHESQSGGSSSIMGGDGSSNDSTCSSIATADAPALKGTEQDRTIHLDKCIEIPQMDGSKIPGWEWDGKDAHFDTEDPIESVAVLNSTGISTITKKNTESRGEFSDSEGTQVNSRASPETSSASNSSKSTKSSESDSSMLSCLSDAFNSASDASYISSKKMDRVAVPVRDGIVEAANFPPADPKRRDLFAVGNEEIKKRAKDHVSKISKDKRKAHEISVAKNFLTQQESTPTEDLVPNLPGRGEWSKDKSIVRPPAKRRKRESAASAKAIQNIITSISKVVNDEFGYDATDDQIKTISTLSFDQKNLLLVLPPGSGKTLNILGSICCRRGVAIVITPTHAVSASHEISINGYQSSVMAVHAEAVRQRSQEDEEKLVSDLEGLPSDTDKAIIVLISIDTLTSKPWRSCIKKMAETRVLRLLALDEAHKYVLDDHYREFSAKEKDLKGALKPLRKAEIPILAMSATMDRQVQNKLTKMIKIDFSQEIWDISLGGIVMHRSFATRPMDAMRKTVESAMDQDKRVVIVYTSERKRSNEMISSFEKMLIKKGIDPFNTIAYNGSRPLAMKASIINQFKTGNLRILTATSAADVGIDSKFCGTGVAENPPTDIFDLVQKLYRVKRRGSMFNDPTFLFILSTSSFQKVYWQVRSIRDRKTRQEKTKLFLEVMALLVLERSCISRLIEGRLSGVDANCVAQNDTPCNNCWNCKRSTSTAVDASVAPATEEFERIRVKKRVSKRGIMIVLTDSFNGNEPCRSQLLTMIKAKSNKIWTGLDQGVVQTNDECDRLLLELMVANIVSYRFDAAEQTDQEDGKMHGIGDGSSSSRNLKYKCNSETYHTPDAWLKISNLHQDCDVPAVNPMY